MNKHFDTSMLSSADPAIVIPSEVRVSKYGAEAVYGGGVAPAKFTCLDALADAHQIDRADMVAALQGKATRREADRY